MSRYVRWAGRAVVVLFLVLCTSNVLLPAIARAQFAQQNGATVTEILAALVGQNINARTITLTGDGTYTSDVISIHAGQLRIVPTTVTATGWMRWNSSLEGFEFGKMIMNCAGCALMTDILEPRQSTLPVRVAGTHGFRITPRASVGTCGSDEEPEGTEIVLSAVAATSRTRKCFCTSDGSGTFAWENNRGDVGDSTTCPVVAP